MPSLSRAPKDICELVAEVMQDYHSSLDSASVTVGVLMASPTEREQDDQSPHLRLHGYPAAATISITPVKQRVMGVADSVITLDEATWKGLDEDGRISLVDHELTHITPAMDKDGQFKFDEANRPKLKMHLHDLVVGAFTSIIARHGIKSLDAQQVRLVFEACRQRVFDFADDQGPQDEAPTAADMLGRSA